MKVPLPALAFASCSFAGFIFLKHRASAREYKKHNLKLVQIVFRHGARTPLYAPKYFPPYKYPNSMLEHEDHTFISYVPIRPDGQPYSKNMLFERGPHGKLTKAGAHQLYLLGCYIRQKYIEEMNFIAADYSDDLQVHATEVPRAIESARSALAGLYPGTKQHIPILIDYVAAEKMFPNFENCALLKSLSKCVWKDPDTIEEMKSVRGEIQTAYKIPPDEKIHIVTLRDCIAANRFHGLLCDDFKVNNVEQVLERAAVRIMDVVFAGDGATRDLTLKLGIGPLLEVFLNNMELVEQERCMKKMYLYSGHDTTLIPLLHALGVYDSKWPPYSASITFEMYEKEPKEYFVRVLYLNEAKVLPGCDSEFCPLNQFKESLSKYRISDNAYKAECAL